MAKDVSIAEIEMEMITELARRIVMLRRMSGVSRDTVSKGCGMSHNTLAKIENGRGLPSLHQLTRLSVVLDVPLYILFAPSEMWKSFITKDL